MCTISECDVRPIDNSLKIRRYKQKSYGLLDAFTLKVEHDLPTLVTFHKVFFAGTLLIRYMAIKVHADYPKIR